MARNSGLEWAQNLTAELIFPLEIDQSKPLVTIISTDGYGNKVHMDSCFEGTQTDNTNALNKLNLSEILLCQAANLYICPLV